MRFHTKISEKKISNKIIDAKTLDRRYKSPTNSFEFIYITE